MQSLVLGHLPLLLQSEHRRQVSWLYPCMLAVKHRPAALDCAIMPVLRRGGPHCWFQELIYASIRLPVVLVTIIQPLQHKLVHKSLHFHMMRAYAGVPAEQSSPPPPRRAPSPSLQPASRPSPHPAIAAGTALRLQHGAAFCQSRTAINPYRLIFVFKCPPITGRIAAVESVTRNCLLLRSQMP